MRFDRPRLSLKARLIWSYLVILGAGGLATSLVGSWIVSSTIMMQARQAVDHDFATARKVYDEQLQSLRLSVEFAAAGAAVQQYVTSGEGGPLSTYLKQVRQDGGFDFLIVTDGKGRVVLQDSQLFRTQQDVSSVSVVSAALAGKVAAATEIVSAALIGNGNRTALDPVYSHAFPAGGGPGMALVVAAPLGISSGQPAGTLFGGILLNGNFAIVDSVWKLLFRGERFKNVDIGLVTIFERDVRVSTSVRTPAADRAIGTGAPAEVSNAVLKRGELWSGRAYVVNHWYIAEYAPIRNYTGAVIGMLSVGRLEDTYTSVRDRVILSFFGIATAGFLLILGITYYMIQNVTRPISEMVAATQNITAGRFDQEVRANASREIALLADSFNTMLKSLRQMKADLEEWNRTLEEKVKHEAEQLVAMQARVAQSERLASLGMLAAGVAHEVNNPLGGILALTSLSVEDMREDDPNRENLQEVIRQTERCRDIVKGLLEFSRQSKGNMEAVDLNKVVHETLSLIGKQAIFFNIDVVWRLQPELPPVVADPSQFQQVFINILMNAVQAMDERGTITIDTRHNTADNFVEVAISDTGRGIPAEYINRIFDPFFTTRPGGHGTGLGLSIAYGIVTTHGGSISVRSQAGKGSTFTIRVPAAVSVRLAP